MTDADYAGGRDAIIQDGAVVGLKYSDRCEPAVVGDNAFIRSGSVIYADVRLGDHFQCGHNVTIRARTTIGRHVTVGTNSVIEGDVEIGDFVKIESNCFVPTHVLIGSRVFLGPNVVMLNDRYPLRRRDQYRPEGPVLEDNVTVGAAAVLCPGVRIGAGSFIAAGAVVTKDVPPGMLAVGVPARPSPLPEELDEPNMALSWLGHIDE